MPTNGCIKMVCDRIATEYSPRKVILFHVKRSGANQIRSFKVCVIIETNDKESIEKRIYLEIDCEIPFDVLVYTPGEWEDLLKQEDSFANRILREGTCVYGCEETQGRE